MKKFPCPYPWLQISTEPEETLRVCCYGGAGKGVEGEKGLVRLNEVKNPNNFLNIPHLRELRKKMLEGEVPPFCRGCHKLESHGGESPRTLMLEAYKDIFDAALGQTSEDGSIKSPKVKIVELTLGNTCNLKCRMCSPFFSHLLEKDFNDLGIKYDKKAVDDINSSFKNFNEHRIFFEQADSLELLSFLGGEPLIHPYHEKVLTFLVNEGRSGDIELRYNSNLTVLGQSLKKYWSKFKKIKLSLSLESTGKLNDYIRYPSKFEVIQKNMEEIIEWKKEGVPLELSITSVFQAYSLPGIIELLEWLKNYKEYIPSIPHFIFLDFPPYLAAGVLPTDIKAEIKTGIEEYLIKNRDYFLEGPFKKENARNLGILENNLQLMMSDEGEPLFMEFVVFTKKMDRLRGHQSFFESYPALLRKICE